MTCCPKFVSSFKVLVSGTGRGFGSAPQQKHTRCRQAASTNIETPMNNERQTKIVTILSVLFLVGLSITLLTVVTHDIWIRKHSKFRYTVVELTGFYFKGNVNGKEIRYSLNGTDYIDHCGDQNCKNAKLRDKYFIKVYLDDPEVFDIMWTHKIKNVDSIPKTGWGQLPVRQVTRY